MHKFHDMMALPYNVDSVQLVHKVGIQIK